MLADIVRRSRSYRRFDQSVAIERATLEELVDIARFCPSGINRQPLKYFLSSDEPTNAKVFDNLAWAGYLKEWPGPVAGERPAGYIIILKDGQVAENAGCDHGIAAQTILLAAVEMGWGGCMIGSVKRAALAGVLELPEQYEIMLVVALGKPIEEVVIDDVDGDGDIKYWRDEQQVHHVPKRSLAEVIVG